jgi:hypothetical protein
VARAVRRAELERARGRGMRLIAEDEERLHDHEQQDRFQCWECGAVFAASSDPEDVKAQKRAAHHAQHDERERREVEP